MTDETDIQAAAEILNDDLQDTDDTMSPEPTGITSKPLIGLALGSGVAKGWAHIGVVRALERAGIYADVICGTSAGGLVGGVHLAGHLNELEDFARSMTKRGMLRYLDIATGSGGLIGGNRLNKLLEENLGDIRVENLGRRFVAVTTELATGHEIWLREGKVVDAVQATYALPGVFPPKKINNRWLIDGALVNPVPVSVCRAFGARMVIAVNLNADVFGPGSHDAQETIAHLEQYPQLASNQEDTTPLDDGQLPDPPDGRSRIRRLLGLGDATPGLTTVMLTSLNVVQDRLARSRLAGDPPDLTIQPRIGHIGALDFDKADELIAQGEAAAEYMIPQILKMQKFLT